MDPVNAQELATILTVFVSFIEKVGAEGLMGAVFGGPLLMMAAFYFQTWHHERNGRRMFEETRKLLMELWEKHRAETSRLQEDHRRESSAIIKELGAGLTRTTRYYEDNVELVKNYEKMAQSMAELIATNIKEFGRISSQLEILVRTMVNK